MPPPWHHLCYHRNHQPENFRKTRQSAWFVGGWTSCAQLVSTPPSTGCRTTCWFASRPSRYQQTTMETEPKQKYWQLFDTIKVSAYFISWMLMLQNFYFLRRFRPQSQMPRRESARRNHPLARECDIVETLHMRLTLLQVRNVMNFNRTIIISFVITKANLIVAAQMTFGKHIERKHICFFPGEVRLHFLTALYTSLSELLWGFCL